MEEVLALIEKIIEEHKLIIQRVQTLERVANDATALAGLDKAKEDFVPGRFGAPKPHLENLKASLDVVDEGIQAHFGREETGLLAAFDKHGGKMLASGLRTLLGEHEELRGRLVKLEKDVTELAVNSWSREVWEGRAWGMRVYLYHTRKLFEVHARSEQKLLRTLRNRLRREIKGS
jgi:hemerythrin-like domain-containing protein